jgi:hypothetical protein
MDMCREASESAGPRDPGFESRAMDLGRVRGQGIGKPEVPRQLFGHDALVGLP